MTGPTLVVLAVMLGSAAITGLLLWAELRDEHRRNEAARAEREQAARDARIAAGFAAGWHGGRGR